MMITQSFGAYQISATLQLPQWAAKVVKEQQGSKPELETELYTDLTLSWILKCYDRYCRFLQQTISSIAISIVLTLQWTNRCSETPFPENWSCCLVPCNNS